MNSKQRRMYLRMITKSLWRRMSRVLIASLSIAVGAATLSGLGLVAYTVPKQLTAELRSYGANMVVLPQGADAISPDKVEDVDKLAGDKTLGRAGYQYSNLLYNQQSIQVVATNMDDVAKVRPYWEIDGERPTGPDQILVGESVAELYRFEIGKNVGLTEPTTEKGTAKQLKVSGILRTGGPEDDSIVMTPEGLAQFNVQPGYNLVEYSIDGDTATINQLAGEITESNEGVEAEVVRRTSENESGIAQTMQTLIWMVSAIIVVLTVISVSATLNAIVTERAKEFGLKKALGALSNDIMGELLGESVLLGLFGGAIGVAVGIWIADVISVRAFAIDLNINWWVVPITLLISTAISLAGTLLPARRISQIKPSNVLSGE
ncbi:ABC transporter permease [Propionimicrobium lymphophilum]|uniref:ABC transporter permease n=1 Tax=Propionimicrobium TaxID=203133 RepID=UPI0003D797C3|nr:MULTISPECIES: ABC transporter permease [Propionimicrobium]ETJ97574.1 MacB-like periplasmic core domain protein [Propionimicrobium sp. BV2F7]MDK7710445.1 ABC transporter permease [Propionimicrobium lymphophilum]MDK7733705.1 ABC transporter permease [Propionimicrobium lymphophilum]